MAQLCCIPCKECLTCVPAKNRKQRIKPDTPERALSIRADAKIDDYQCDHDPNEKCLLKQGKNSVDVPSKIPKTEVSMDSSSFVFRALELYGTRFHHPGQWRIHAKLREALHANVDCYMEVERKGLTWVLNPFDYVQQNLFWLGEHDRWDTFHVKRLLAPDAVICDIGANFGYYSVTLAEYLKPKGRVFAFEPHPATRDRLERHVAMNQLGEVVKVMPCALSDAPGTLRMTFREDNTGAAHISSEGNIEVEVSTLDSFCDLHELSRLDFVKIDVEGFEVRVLRGGEHTLRTLRPKLFVEMLPVQLERTGSSAAELADTLRGYGYSLFVSDRKRLLPLIALPGESDLVNVFCLPGKN